MKKLIYSMLMLAAMISFTACEDVPSPYDVPTEAGGGSKDGDYSAAAGSGTLADPYNTTAILKLTTSLAAGAESAEQFYFKGKVVSIVEEFGTQYGNATFYLSDDGTPTNQFYVYQALYLGNKKYKSGTNIKEGDEVVVCGKVTNFKGNTPETVKGSAYVYSINGDTGSGSETPAETIGTKDNPKTCAEALTLINALADGTESDGYAYVKGKVVKVTTNETNFAKYGNLNYWISDDGTETNQIQVYSGDGLNGEKFKSIKDIGPGDEVVVYGKLYKYVKDGKMTPEINSGNYLVQLTKGSGGGGNDNPQPSGSSTLNNPFTVAEALGTINAMGDNETTNDNYYIKGKVSRKANTADEIGPNSSKKYKDMNYYISDDGSQSNELYVYRGKYLDGADFTDFEQLKEGDEVIIYGQLQKYIDSKNGNAVVPEVKNSKIVKLNGQTGPSNEPTNGPGTVSGNTITVQAVDFGVANGVAMGTQVLADGTKLEFDGGGNTNAPKYYDAGTNIRMYPKNSVTITASKNIEKVVFNCDEYQGTICNASGDISASPGTATVDGKVVSIKQINSKTTTISNTSGGTGAASQIRIVSIEITYVN